MIKALKIGDNIFTNIPLSVSQQTEKEINVKVATIDKNGKDVYTTEKQTVVEYEDRPNDIVPQDLVALKKAAIDTINWQIGESVKKPIGNTQTSLSAANAKSIALLVKLMKPTATQLSTLSPLEKDNYDKLKMLATNGYADSKLLNASLSAVMSEVQKGTDKIARVASAKSIDEVINILNEE